MNGMQPAHHHLHRYLLLASQQTGSGLYQLSFGGSLNPWTDNLVRYPEDSRLKSCGSGRGSWLKNYRCKFSGRYAFAEDQATRRRFPFKITLSRSQHPCLPFWKDIYLQEQAQAATYNRVSLCHPTQLGLDLNKGGNRKSILPEESMFRFM